MRDGGPSEIDASGIESIANEIADAHGCHTIVLYGSRARGDADAGSDVDLLCIREAGPAIRDARVVDGIYFDAFVCPASAVAAVDPPLLRILGGRVLRERDGAGSALLDRVRALFDKGPDLLPADDRTMRVAWAHKVLARLRRDDGVETAYRRRSFTVQALEDYFALRTLWFRGPRHAFAWLQLHDETVHEAFEAALRPMPAPAALAALVDRVYGPLPAP